MVAVGFGLMPDRPVIG
jgi:transcriptional regulator with XRE-family HTH domain